MARANVSGWKTLGEMARQERRRRVVLTRQNSGRVTLKLE